MITKVIGVKNVENEYSVLKKSSVWSRNDKDVKENTCSAEAPFCAKHTRVNKSAENKREKGREFFDLMKVCKPRETSCIVGLV